MRTPPPFFALAALLSGPARACCAVGPGGRPVEICHQYDLVVYNPATKIEHFVRMTFKTDRPFAPYAVPKENGGANLLRLFLVTPQKMRGRIGDGPKWSPGPNESHTLEAGYARRIEDDLKLPKGAVPDNAEFPAYWDAKFGTVEDADLFFDREPISAATLAGGTALGAILLGGIALFAKRKRA